MRKGLKTAQKIGRFAAVVAFGLLLRPLLWMGIRRRSVPQPVFIIGAPRTGSTVLYQALTHSFDVLYIDNLAGRYYRHLPTGLLLSRLRFGGRPHGNFRSEFGETGRYGAHAPSECGPFWYRFFSTERHHATRHDLSRSSTRKLRREVLGTSGLAGRSMIFKNLNAGQRLDALHECFPEARYIFVRRERAEVVSSITRARAKLGIGPGVWWSVQSADFEDLLHLEEPQMIVQQVERIEAQIERDVDELGLSGRVRTVWYSEFGDETLRDLGAWLGLKPRRGGNFPVIGNEDRVAES